MKNSFFDKQNQLKRVVNILASTPLFGFKIVRFKDKTHKDPKPRFWLTFKIEDEAYCFLSTFTSQTTLIELYKHDDNALDSIVFISKDEFNPPFTAETTYLDCNIQDLKHRRTFKELREDKIDWQIGLDEIEYKIPEAIKNKIIKAIVNSNFTNYEIKNGFKKSYANLFNESVVDKSNILD